MRFTKIICTLGPQTHTPEQVLHLATSGMNVARINLSHGSRESHHEQIRTIRELNRSGVVARVNPRVPVIALLLDTKGAEIRTGDVKEPMTIAAGEEVVFSPKALSKEKRTVIIVDYDKFHIDVREATNILIDNGKIGFELVSIEQDGTVVARAIDDGVIGSRRHINLPGANVDLPPITPKDWEDIEFAADEGVDYIGLSFIQKGAHVEEVREFLRKKGKNVGLIAKIETQRAVQNLSEILHASDGLMVARGDLGAEVPFETLPVIQDEMVEMCREAGKPVIVATHMLESMISNPMPTRAEVTDIAHAASTGTDATMLSGETASGKYPFTAVEAMARILKEAEKHVARSHRLPAVGVRSEREARAEAVVRLAGSANAAAIIVITRSGQSAREISRFRPTHPILAFTSEEDIQRRLQLFYGVIPMCTKLLSDPEKTVENAISICREKNFLQSGDSVVLVSDTKAGNTAVSTIQIRTIA